MYLPAIIGPMSGFSLYIMNAMARTVLMVTDPTYRGSRLRLSAMERGLMPRQHAVAIEGRRDPDGRMAFLLSDPDRPSQVYARYMAERRREDAPSDCPDGASSAG